MSPLRDESGFTLTELLVAMVVGLLVLFGVLGLMDTTVRLSSKTADRVETTARARVAMDVVTQRIRAQVCLGDGAPALAEAGPSSLTFYASLAPASASLQIQKRTITYVADAAGGPGRIDETVWVGSGARPAVLFDAAPTTRTLVADVVPVGSTPIFRYFRFAVPAGETLARPTEIVTAPPLPLADRERTVQVDIAFAAVGRTAKARAELSNRVYVRNANPAKPETSPLCL